MSGWVLYFYSQIFVKQDEMPLEKSVTNFDSGGEVVKLLAPRAKGLGSDPGLATLISEISFASKSRYDWKIF